LAHSPPIEGRNKRPASLGEEQVSAGASQVAARMAGSTAQPFIAADVGGTHARLGLVRAQDPSGRKLVVDKYKKYVCAEYPSLAAILRDFIESLNGSPVRDCAIACAGYCLDGTVINTNLPWAVSLTQMRAELNLHAIEFVNDFEAVAYATQHLVASDITLLTHSAVYSADAPILVVGPGTGLGAAVRIPYGDNSVVLATEAGQAAFAPSTDREIEILRILRRGSSHVSNEQVLSGPGLVNLYSALCDLHATPAVLNEPAAITDAALHAGDAIARESLDVFCGLMGSVLGNLVLLYGAQGGAYLAGGILPQIKRYLMASSFLERFVDKGAMRPVLERVPVSLIEQNQLGVLGAASWFLRSHEQQ
jgi:glucokinase